MCEKLYSQLANALETIVMVLRSPLKHKGCFGW